MKNFFVNMVVAAILFCGAVVANAQEHVVLQSLDNMEVTHDSTKVEYAPKVYAAVAKYQHDAEEKGLRRWYRQMPVGNNTQTQLKVWEMRREGPDIGIGVTYSRFDGYDLVGPSAEVEYMRRYYGFGLTVAGLFNGHEDRTSERQKKFIEFNSMLRWYSPVLEFKVGGILGFRAYLEGSYKKRWDFHTLESSSVEITETDDEWITTTTTTQRNLDARPHVFGWAGGIRAEYHPKDTPWIITLDCDYGKSKNFTYVAQQILDQVKVTVGVKLILNHGGGYVKAPHGSKNTYLYEDYGYTRQEVKKLAQ